MSNKDFYRAFEDKHRGSRELIKERLKVYLPFLLPYQTLYPDGIALDIGCGRGEWLELLKENNIQAQGIDSDNGMLEACHRRDLDVKQEDGITYLKEQPDESFIIVSAFHVVEHISFEELQELIQESLRVLKPGGLLILETPNPENIKVATENFYLDPTHIKPIPSTLLSFLPEYYGFERTKVLRLQETKSLVDKENINLLDVLGGVSPDYAVVAQKSTNEDTLMLFDDIFAQDIGLSWNELVSRFEARLVKIEERAAQADQRATQAEERATQAEERVAQADQRAIQAETRYTALVQSNSWKLTKPYRYLGRKMRRAKASAKAWLTLAPASRLRKTVKNRLLSLKYYMHTHPRLKRKILIVLRLFPKLEARLKNIGRGSVSNVASTSNISHVSTVEQLSPRARAIYMDLKKAIEEQKGSKPCV